MKTDAQIQKEVMDELNWEPVIDATEIGVAVKKGIVTLTGTVNTFTKKVAAENAAKRVGGVKAVAEDIEVIMSAEHKKNDTEIAEAILNALKWHNAIEEDKIKVTVEDGLVTLEGEVEWEFQKSAARYTIENLIGVKGINNNIRITPKPAGKDIRQRINIAFNRNATIDAKKINIEIIEGKVILTGKVRSLSEKKDAEATVWSAPGVHEVVNKIEIEEPVLLAL